MAHVFSLEECERYSRHFSLSEVGFQGQQRLATAKVLFVGAGGLGSSALAYLAATGVGTLGIVDGDEVELSNLQRQILYSYNDLGKKKTRAASARLQIMNPAVQINVYDFYLTPENAEQLIFEYDFIADGSDNFATSYLINDVCSRLKKPWIYASISKFQGQCALFLSQQRSTCLRCVFDVLPPAGTILNCAEEGVLGVLPGLMGSIQAIEILKWILNIGQNLTEKLLVFDALNMDFREFKIQQNPQCKLCQKSINEASANFAQNISFLPSDEMSKTEFLALRQSGEDFFLLDVREPFEYEREHLGGQLIPLKSLPSRIHELDKEKCIVVYCQKGGRSRQAVDFLKLNGFKQVYNLTGGIVSVGKII